MPRDLLADAGPRDLLADSSPAGAPQVPDAFKRDVAPAGTPAPVGTPSIVDRLQTNPAIGAPLQTLLQGGQGAEQLITHAAASASDLGGAAPNSLSAMLHLIADHVDTATKAQRQGYEDAGARVDADSTDPRLSGALRRTGETMGNMVNPAGLSGNAIEAAPGIINAATRGAASGAGFAASQPMDEFNWGGKAKQVAVGTAVGGATGGVAEALAGNKTSQPPSTQDIRTQSQDRYRAVEVVPVPVTPKMAEALAGPSGQAAIKRALDGAEANRETALASELKSLLTDNENLPKLVERNPDIAISANAADKISGAFARSARAEYRSDAGDSNVARGLFARRADVEDALNAVPQVKDARSLWAQAEKSQVIDETIQAAKDAPSTPTGTGDLNTALRREFGKLIRSDDFDSFSPIEKAAIKRVANGNLTANILQRLGKFSPVRGHLTGLLEILGTGYAGHALAGDVGVLPAVGMVAAEGARQGATLATLHNAQSASRVVRGGNSLASIPGPTPNIPRWNNPLATYAAQSALQPRGQ